MFWKQHSKSHGFKNHFPHPHEIAVIWGVCPVFTHTHTSILLSYPIHTNIPVWSTISYGLPFFGDFSCGDPDQLINQRVGKGHLWRITQFQKHHSDYNWSYTPHHIAIFSQIKNKKSQDLPSFNRMFPWYTMVTSYSKPIHPDAVPRHPQAVPSAPCSCPNAPPSFESSETCKNCTFYMYTHNVHIYIYIYIYICTYIYCIYIYIILCMYITY